MFKCHFSVIIVLSPNSIMHFYSYICYILHIRRGWKDDKWQYNRHTSEGRNTVEVTFAFFDQSLLWSCGYTKLFMKKKQHLDNAIRNAHNHDFPTHRVTILFSRTSQAAAAIVFGRLANADSKADFFLPCSASVMPSLRTTFMAPVPMLML